MTSQGPVTRSQARKKVQDQTTFIAFGDLEINPIELSEQNSTHLNIDIIDKCLAISAVLISDEQIYSVTIDQNLAEPSNVDEVLNDPLWKNSMDNEHKTLINKHTVHGKSYYLPRMQI